MSALCTTAAMQPYAGKDAILRVLYPNLEHSTKAERSTDGPREALESEVVRSRAIQESSIGSIVFVGIPL